MKIILLSATLIVLLVPSLITNSWARWVVNDNNQCVEIWTPIEILNGPKAIINGVLVPIRSIAGTLYIGSELLINNRSDINIYDIWLPPVVLIITTLTGTLEGASWIIKGAGDTITGGVFHFTSEESTELSIKPIIQLPDARREKWQIGVEDRCGRPIDKNINLKRANDNGIIN